MIIKFKLFENKFDIITDEEYDDYLEIINYHFADMERSKQDLNWYLEIISELQKTGGEVYRLVFLKDKSDLNTDELGDHWTLQNDFGGFYNSLRDDYWEDGLYPYVITAKIEPNSINVYDSLEYYTELPNELEINLTKQPIDFTIQSM